MSTDGENELDDLIGEWADAASIDADDLDSLADAWAKEGQKNLSAPPYVPPPPAPDEPITLPKKPEPVLLPPLPEGDFADAAKRGDTRYASWEVTPPPLPAERPQTKPVIAPIQAARPIPKPAPPPEPEPIISRAPDPEPAKPAPATPIAPIKAPEPVKAPAAELSTPKPAEVDRPVLEKAPAAQTRTVHEYMDEDETPAWLRWLPIVLLGLGGIAFLILTALTGGRSPDTSGEPIIIDQPDLSGESPAAPDVPSSNEAPAPKIIDQPELAAPHTPAIESPPPVQDSTAPADETKISIPSPVEETADPFEPVIADPLPADPSPADKNRVDPALEDQTPLSPSQEQSIYNPEPETVEPVIEESLPPATNATAIEIATNDAAPVDTTNLTAPSNAPPSLKPDDINSNVASSVTSTSEAPERVTITRTVSPSTPSTERTVTTTSPRTTSNTTVRRTYVTNPQSQTATRSSAFSPSIENVITRNASGAPITAAELLYEKAATGARGISTPEKTLAFSADIKRALDFGQDDTAQALQTPDGRLLALKVERTQSEQLRTVLIPRAPEVAKMPDNLILENGSYRLRGRTGLRANPWEGPATRSLEIGELVESIGTVEGTNWRLIGQNGRAIGYLLSDEIESTNTSGPYPARIDDPKSTRFDIVRAKTVCRSVQYAIDGSGESGSFTACRAYGGEWVLQQGGDTPALSPGQYVFRQ